MRVLTVRQPWAWALIHGGKDVENRTRNVAGKYRGPVAIHTSAAKRDDLTYTQDALGSPYADWSSPEIRMRLLLASPLHHGAVIGVVDLVDVHDGDECNGGWLCSPWAMPGHIHIRVANPRALRAPVAARGSLGLWTPAAELLEQIREQMP